jgi:hypothetical protein
MRMLLCCAAATLLALTAPLAGAGPSKQYSLSLAIAQANYGTVNGQNVLQGPVVLTVNVKNESPPSTANSTISSFKFTLYGVTMVGDPVCPNARCSLDTGSNTVIVTNISPPIQPGPGFPVTVQASSCGNVKAPVAQTFVYGGSQLTGAQFSVKNQPNTVSISCGDFACVNNDIFFTVPDSTTPVAGTAKYVTGLRSQFDKNGACVGVSYDVTNTIPTDNRLHFEWDTATDDAAVFAYQVNVNNDDPVNFPIQVSWRNNPDGTPSFIVAPPCNTLSTNPPDDLPLPASYGALASAMKSSDKSLKIDTSSALVPAPNPVPALGFPIVIGSERMQVTKITTNTWTVSRTPGAVGHDLGATVMSTPLPLLTGYVFTDSQKTAGYNANNQAQVCIAQQTNPVNGGKVTSAWIIDIGDAWTQGR